MRPITITAIVALIATFSGCEHFYDVTIPLSDTTPPSALTSLYFDAEHQELSTGDSDPIDYVMTDGSKSFWVIAAVIDEGGAESVDLYWNVTNYCQIGSVGQIQIPPLTVPMSETQSGNPGDSVKNGLWVGRVLNFSQMSNPCQAGWTWVSTTVEWSATGSDFYGNTGSNGSSRVRYFR